jgi:nucleoside phosphorylase
VNWDQAKVHFGLILTGEKLVDNIDFRNQLGQFEPEAVGGEMEGAGLYVACQDKKVDWILVKAICDWADGRKNRNKQKRQTLAANNASRFVVHALEQAPLRQKRENTDVPKVRPPPPFFSIAERAPFLWSYPGAGRHR